MVGSSTPQRPHLHALVPATLALKHAVKRAAASPSAETLQGRAPRPAEHHVATGPVARTREISRWTMTLAPGSATARGPHHAASARLPAPDTACSAHAASPDHRLSHGNAAAPSSCASLSQPRGSSHRNSAPEGAPARTTDRTPSAGTPVLAHGRYHPLVFEAVLVDLRVGPREVPLPAGQVSEGRPNSLPGRFPDPPRRTPSPYTFSAHLDQRIPPVPTAAHGPVPGRPSGPLRTRRRQGS